MQNKICLGGIDNDNIGQGVNTITNKQCQPLGEKIECEIKQHARQNLFGWD
jgi:hypothetical protein